ncbi:MAG: type IX secretion system outer membrane channel protein PorV [Chitinophagales bacterium]|nr:type IX secretion system outer membrane channel protein PorV [Bacteroidota bacterium]
MRYNPISTYIFTTAILLLFCTTLHAQINSSKGGINTVNSAVPFLRIIPDARGGGMGDVGIATSVDPNASFYNASKLAFAKRKLGFSLSYAPWLRALGITDIFMTHFTFYYKVTPNDVIHTSLKFFSLGDIEFTDNAGNSIGNGSPRELSFDAGYTRRLGKHFGLGVAFRYIYSNLAQGQSIGSVPIKAGHAGAADLTATYNLDMKVGKRKKMDGNFMAGIAITNMGSKISYTADAVEKDFIPANLGIGVGFRLQPTKQHEWGIYLDANKLLVPTPDSTDSDGDNIPDFKQQSSFKGLFTSLGDAPGGFKEEMREWTMGIGTEYWYDHIFGVRAGYFLEAKDKGYRRFVSTGIGVKYSVFGLDFSYLIPTGGARNPLDNTFRFTLKFDFAKVGGNKVDIDGDDINDATDKVDKGTRKRLKKQKAD